MTRTEQGFYVGEVVHKVGRTTGWTTGTIDVTCADLLVEAFRAILCGTRTYMWTGQGDSGAAVFARNGDDEHNDKSVTMLGILFYLEHGTEFPDGKRSNTSWFAGYRAFEWDLRVLDQGILNPRADPTTVPASAFIAGPQTLAPGENGTWSAVVTNGTSPFTYLWSGDASGTGSSTSGTYYNDAMLDVWDALGKHVRVYQRVAVGTCTPGIPC